MSDYQAQRTADYFDKTGMEEWERLVATPVDEVSLYIHTHYLPQTCAGRRTCAGDRRRRRPIHAGIG